ncbi:MAG TPA: hypothetical protein VFU26_02620 [Gaiellaceae bacterium]|nr:hypothetical protein [Gaiellaceae bacterium]
MRLRVLLGVAAVIGCGIGAVPAASGDGGPGPGVRQGWDGVAAKTMRYVPVTTAGGTTLLAIERRGGRVVNYLNLKGQWGVPAVAYDGLTGGLARDGKRLVLAEVRTRPDLRKRSSFLLVNVKQLRVIRKIQLKGDQSFDALSPDAHFLYLVEFVSAQDLSRYRVRAFDIRANKLLPKPVVDKREWEETMQGSPVSRVESPDATWVYTLYAGGKHPFVHALDTRHVQAVCVDLPRAWNQLDVGGMRLRWGADGRILVRHVTGGKTFATIDAKSLRVVSLVRIP